MIITEIGVYSLQLFRDEICHDIPLSNARYLQQKQRNQAVEKLPMFENNHKPPNLAGMTVYVVRWGCPKRISNDCT